MIRNRKMVALTISDAARDALDSLSAKHGVTRSALVEALLFDAAGISTLAAQYPPRARARASEAPPPKKKRRKR